METWLAAWERLAPRTHAFYIRGCASCRHALHDSTHLWLALALAAAQRLPSRTTTLSRQRHALRGAGTKLIHRREQLRDRHALGDRTVRDLAAAEARLAAWQCLAPRTSALCIRGCAGCRNALHDSTLLWL